MNTILQLTDTITGRRCAVRIAPEEAAAPLSGLLERYVKHSPTERLLQENRATPESSESLLDFQDVVYGCSDSGLLQGIYQGVEFVQDGSPVAVDGSLSAQTTRVGEVEVEVLDVGIDRTNAGYDRNWAGFHRRRWDRHAYIYDDFVRGSLLRDNSEGEADRILQLQSSADKTTLVKSLARRVWDSDFESYSRFVDRRLPYKTGDETVRNIIARSGGICSEKVQALKFLTDHFGIESEYLIAGADTPGPVPEDRLKEMLETFDFRFAKRHMRYWQHTALLYRIEGQGFLVDATNGNIPFLFLDDIDSRQMLSTEDKAPVKIRMAVQDEDFYYHRVSQDIPENLLFAMGAWVPEIDLVQVFDNELGLIISPGFFVTPIVYKSETNFEQLRSEYVQAAETAGLECWVGAEWTLDSALGERFVAESPSAAEKILEAEGHLLARYNQWEASEHDAGLVVMALGRDGQNVPDPR
ncbi:MAG: hypothetical protein O3A47_05520 [Chloroflexi bacterium]|nr:hypothetical protein [Chloroflexota bacterium]